jgi:hypothetical protein
MAEYYDITIAEDYGAADINHGYGVALRLSGDSSEEAYAVLAETTKADDECRGLIDRGRGCPTVDGSRMPPPE